MEQGRRKEESRLVYSNPIFEARRKREEGRRKRQLRKQMSLWQSYLSCVQN